MEKRSKSTMELFHKKYSVKKLVTNPFLMTEAIGWLKCTRQYCPSLSKEIDNEISAILLVLELSAEI